MSFASGQLRPGLLQKEIEALIKSGLQTEKDYAILESAYATAGFPQQSKFVTIIKKEKYPNGEWVFSEAQRKFYMEKDPVKKEQLLASMMKKAETDENWKDVKLSAGQYNSALVSSYLGKSDWEGLKNAVARTGLDEKSVAYIYNTAAWNIAEKEGDNVKKYGEEFARIATTWAKGEFTKPTGVKPVYDTRKAWEESRMNTYASYADTYALLLYKLGEYNSRYVKIDIDDIMYIEGCGNYLNLITTQKKWVVLCTMKEMEAALPAHSFCRVHRSYIVAINKICAFDKAMVYIADKTIPIGYQYRDCLPEKIVIVPVSSGIQLSVNTSVIKIG